MIGPTDLAAGRSRRRGCRPSAAHGRRQGSRAGDQPSAGQAHERAAQQQPRPPEQAETRRHPCSADASRCNANATATRRARPRHTATRPRRRRLQRPRGRGCEPQHRGQKTAPWARPRRAAHNDDDEGRGNDIIRSRTARSDVQAAETAVVMQRRPPLQMAAARGMGACETKNRRRQRSQLPATATRRRATCAPIKAGAAEAPRQQPRRGDAGPTPEKWMARRGRSVPWRAAASQHEHAKPRHQHVGAGTGMPPMKRQRKRTCITWRPRHARPVVDRAQRERRQQPSSRISQAALRRGSGQRAGQVAGEVGRRRQRPASPCVRLQALQPSAAGSACR